MANEMPDRAHIEKSLKSVLDSQELLEATFKPLSQMLFQKYTALVEAGFSRDEALAIIKERGLNA